ncbi:DUF2637 domain-containing protein [Streptomyces sp. NPDC052012]|uniref:DUF2637 domain-containing protein n=1 Tax=Streptomyces sp. NPDC052012 TaxID=3155051 RepID=UPI00344E5694
MVAGEEGLPRLVRAHRVLLAVVTFGVAVIAGVGFVGSYVAVRELAHDKGFGGFSYLFPVGIDAGICVLLALDLLLTWLRMPLSLLRQTAWLLTLATIAFNGAAAWPDLLGVSMHAVIPVLFVVAVEAARHAIGRIAAVTAGRHMEAVRRARWLLAPVSTFLLWRRMKLWELRSYEQVIRLERERLVYRASLRSRFGRAWRRKAPVEALIPLRLARYGVPLAETAAAGLAAAGIEQPPIPFTCERTRDAAGAHSPERGSTDQGLEDVAATVRRRGVDAGESATEQDAPDPSPSAAMEHAGGGGQFDQMPVGSGAHPAGRKGPARVRAAIDHPPREDTAPEKVVALTTVDRYYLAWTGYHREHGEEPNGEEFSAYLARKGLHGRGGRPVSPSNVRRHFVRWRVYDVWAEQREHGDAPSPVEVARVCAARGITAQYNRPITPTYVADASEEFERRWQALTCHAQRRP